MTPRATAPPAACHVCEKHGRACSSKSDTGSHSSEADAPTPDGKGEASTVVAGAISLRIPYAPSSSPSTDASDETSARSLAVSVSAPLVSPVDVDLESRLNADLAATADLIAEAQAQLAALPLPRADAADHESAIESLTSDSNGQIEFWLEEVQNTHSTESIAATSPESEAWFDAEEGSIPKVNSIRPWITAAAGTQTATSTKPAKSTADAGSQTEVRQRPTAVAGPPGSAVTGTANQPASRKPNSQQGWHTLWSIDCKGHW